MSRLPNTPFSLESQLNTVGIPGALHESIQGRDAAFSKFARAQRRGQTETVPPPSYDQINYEDLLEQ